MSVESDLKKDGIEVIKKLDNPTKPEIEVQSSLRDF